MYGSTKYWDVSQHFRATQQGNEMRECYQGAWGDHSQYPGRGNTMTPLSPFAGRGNAMTCVAHAIKYNGEDGLDYGRGCP